MLRDQRRRLLRRLSRVSLPAAEPISPMVSRRSAASGDGGRSVLSRLMARSAVRSVLLHLLPLRRGRTVVLRGSGVLPLRGLTGRGAMAADRPGNGATRAVVPGANGVAVAGDLLRGGATGTVGLVGSEAAGGTMEGGAAVGVGVRRGHGLRRAWER